MRTSHFLDAITHSAREWCRAGPNVNWGSCSLCSLCNKSSGLFCIRHGKISGLGMAAVVGAAAFYAHGASQGATISLSCDERLVSLGGHLDISAPSHQCQLGTAEKRQSFRKNVFFSYRIQQNPSSRVRVFFFQRCDGMKHR